MLFFLRVAIFGEKGMQPLHYNMNYRRLACLSLFLFILLGCGIAHASEQLEEDVQVVAYHGSNSAFSIFYNPAYIWHQLGIVALLAVGFFLFQRHRRKGAS